MIKSIKTLETGAALGLLLLSSVAFGQAEKPLRRAQDRPNILFILVDDLGYADLGCQGSPDIRTPHIDSLAETGIRFSDAYVSAPQCGPSRAGMMTGLNQARFGYYENHHNSGLPDPDQVPLMPEYMKAAGYRTAMIGKWHIGLGTEHLQTQAKDKVRPILSEERINAAKPWKRGFDSTYFFIGGSCFFFPFKAPFSNHPRSHFYTAESSQEEPTEFRLDAEAYVTDFLTDAALDFIGDKKEEPFFLYLAYTAPHDPLQAPPKDIEANGHIKDEKRRTFAGMMTNLDNNIARLLALLEEKGMRDNTLIVFMSDNGGPTHKNTSRNGPFSGKKGDVVEGGIRVPCIMNWRGVFAEGIVYEKPVSSLDLLPTFAAAASATLKSDLEYDGVDLIPYLKSDSKLDTAPRDALYWRWSEKMAMRFHDYKYVNNPAKKALVKGPSVFNLAEDLKETNGTALKLPERLQEMERRYQNYWAQRLDQLTPENSK